MTSSVSNVGFMKATKDLSIEELAKYMVLEGLKDAVSKCRDINILNLLAFVVDNLTHGNSVFKLKEIYNMFGFSNVLEELRRVGVSLEDVSEECWEYKKAVIVEPDQTSEYLDYFLGLVEFFMRYKEWGLIPWSKINVVPGYGGVTVHINHVTDGAVIYDSFTHMFKD